MRRPPFLLGATLAVLLAAPAPNAAAQLPSGPDAPSPPRVDVPPVSTPPPVPAPPPVEPPAVPAPGVPDTRRPSVPAVSDAPAVPAAPVQPGGGGGAGGGGGGGGGRGSDADGNAGGRDSAQSGGETRRRSDPSPSGSRGGSSPGRSPTTESAGGGTDGGTGAPGLTGPTSSAAHVLSPSLLRSIDRGQRTSRGVRERRLVRRLLRDDQAFREVVLGVRRCLSALSPLERRVVLLRAGAGAPEPRSRGAVASRLGLSRARVLRLERGALRQVARVALAGGCGAGGGATFEGGRGARPGTGAAAIPGLTSTTSDPDDRLDVSGLLRGLDDELPLPGGGSAADRAAQPAGKSDEWADPLGDGWWAAVAIAGALGLALLPAVARRWSRRRPPVHRPLPGRPAGAATQRRFHFDQPPERTVTSRDEVEVRERLGRSG